ncbi:AAA family ATPase [Streptomyces antimicrobicus]|uniref:ATP-binding protein n=1 Tax=Streptomyces antimicrobicus TaxID=2883108 RepID=A0ABS8BAA2_9ACTN|nr:AAA family ATPase [Streptomyces antimicrobicus]MCB5181478.1 ATP-binding protein [Streptomyces antimicrobicus]
MPLRAAVPGAGVRGAAPVVRDLRGRAAGPLSLSFAEGDLVVVSGLPGGGKSTLIERTAPAGAGIDSQVVRERWERRMPGWLPYAVYRPAVRVAHYWGLWRAVASGASLVVHDCGTQAWVRAALARAARRRGRALHLLLLDASPREALAGQAARGRGVSAYAFARHRATASRLIRSAESGHLPPGCTTATLLDRPAANRLKTITFHT